jgi:hypothetical protein
MQEKQKMHTKKRQKVYIKPFGAFGDFDQPARRPVAVVVAKPVAVTNSL